MKKFISIFLVLLSIWTLGFPTLAANAIENEISKRVTLSSLTEEECWAYLADKGVTVPLELDEIDIVQLISIYERIPNIVFDFDNAILLDFCEDVRAVVHEYYETSIIMRAITDYTLQYSTLYQTVEKAGQFNCYAYALGLTTHCEPGQFSNGTYNPTGEIDDLATIVVNDIKSQNLADALGNVDSYKCVVQQTNRPSTEGIWDNVIAVRKDTDYFYEEENDYHFAQLDSAGWLHKPSNSQILKFNDLPSNNVVWTNERYTRYAHDWDISYDSDIIYILYKTDHDEYVRTGQHYHSGNYHYFEYNFDCSDCGVEGTIWIRYECDGPPCSLVTSIEETPVTE